MSAATRAWALLLPLLVLAATLPARAQERTPAVTYTVDGGITSGRAIDAELARAIPDGVSWSGGVTLRTRPRPLGRNWHLSFLAALRREQAFAMARVGSTLTPAYLDAFTAASAFELAHRSGSVDTAIAGRFAETRLDSSQRMARADNAIGGWAFLAEAFAEMRWFGSRGTTGIGHDRSAAAIVRAYGGVQHNQRLHRAGDLQPFDDPTGRIAGGVLVTPWRRTVGPTAIAAGAGVEFETAIRAGVRLPSGFRALARATIHRR